MPAVTCLRPVGVWSGLCVVWSGLSASQLRAFSCSANKSLIIAAISRLTDKCPRHGTTAPEHHVAAVNDGREI